MKRNLLLANIAGTLDGEGSFGVEYNPRMNSYLPRVQVHMTEEKPLRRLLGLFGGSMQLVKMDTKGRKQPYHYTASGKNARDLIEQVIPYLIEKRRQAQILLDLQANIDEWNQKPRKRGNLPLDVIDYRKSLYLQCSELKQLPVNGEGFDCYWSDKERVAYLAGYLEAEGCFTIIRGNGNHFYSVISVQVQSKAPLLILEVTFGGTIIEIHKIFGKDLFMWRVKSRPAADVCRAISRYLLFRHEEADIIRTLQNTTDLWAKKVGRRGMPEWLTMKRIEWLNRIHLIHKPERAETKPERPPTVVSDSPICNELLIAGPVAASA